MTDSPSIQLSIVMVTYNSAEVIQHSLVPLLEIPNTELIVVDNNSADSTLKWLGQHSSRIKILENSQNIGFAKAVNQGVKESTGDIIMLLNPDAIILPDGVSGLVDSLTNEDGVGIVAPLIEHPTGRLEIMSAGRFPTSWRMFTHYSGISRISKSEWAQGHYFLLNRALPRLLDVDWVTGACFVMRREHWLQVGGLSERWFMYAEDVELCFKVKSEGLRILVDSSISATHLVGQSDSSKPIKANSSWIVNLFDFYRLNLSRTTISTGVWGFIVAGGLLTRAVAFRIKASRANGGEAKMWMIESRKFRSYSWAVCKEIFRSQKAL